MGNADAGNAATKHTAAGNVVILSGARTPFGRLSGAFASLSAADLGAVAIEGALGRGNVSPSDVDYVIMGHVLQAGAGQITARQAADKAGIPMGVPATTINKVCLSGMNAIYLAARMIEAGDAEVIVAGGMESMTNAPYVMPDARAGLRYGDKSIIDSLTYDGLYCAFDACLMGEGTERYAATENLARDPQDVFAANSHERAATATKDGLFDGEIVSVSVPQRKGDPIVVTADEGIRPGTSAESLGKLRPAFAESGNITAGNASQISDGASAMIITTAERAAQFGVEPMATVLGYGQVAGPDPGLLHQPSNAIKAALADAELTIDDVDLFEINEAFAAVGVASMADLGIDESVCNVNGGAISLGHPLGASGNRITLTLINELKRRGGGVGAAGLCGGGGQGDAIIVKVGA